jgi:hypothetical protein
VREREVVEKKVATLTTVTRTLIKIYVFGHVWTDAVVSTWMKLGMKCELCYSDVGELESTRGIKDLIRSSEDENTLLGSLRIQKSKIVDTTLPRRE